VTDQEYERHLAEQYAVASIIYYTGTGRCPGMTDAQYDGHAAWLLSNKVWQRVTWLDEEMLIAGSGYDVKVFPEYLHKRAARRLAASCDCLRCMLRRGEISDPEVIARLEEK